MQPLIFDIFLLISGPTHNHIKRKKIAHGKKTGCLFLFLEYKHLSNTSCQREIKIHKLSLYILYNRNTTKLHGIYKIYS